jgi:hypothetical protein
MIENIILKVMIWGWVYIQWYRACLACTRPWVLSPAMEEEEEKKKKRNT